MEHVEQALFLHDHDAVSIGVAFRLDQGHTGNDFLALGEIEVRAVSEGHRDNVRKPLQFSGRYLVGVDVNFCIGEGSQFTGMIAVLVRQQDLCHLLRPVTQSGEGFHIAADVLAGIEQTVIVRHLFRSTGNNLVTGINEIVLQAAPIADAGVELFHALFSAESERLRIKTVFSEFNCLDFHL